MSVRYVWIFQLPGTQSKAVKVLFSRKFPTVEKRAKQVASNGYVKVLPDPQMARLIIQEIGYGPVGKKFLAERDSYREQLQKPVFKVRTDEGEIWPLVILQQGDLLLCCLPLTESGYSSSDNNLIDIPSISQGFALLSCLSEALRVTSQEFATRLTELPAFLNEAAPFGCVRDTCADSVLAKLTNRPVTVHKTDKQAAWKPTLHRGKCSIHLGITEYIRASQCDQEEMGDAMEVFGSVLCRAELEGVSADIILNISHAPESLSIPLDQLTVHPCVLSADWMPLPDNKASHGAPAPRRIRFSPPTENFTLCHYSARQLQELPIFGSFTMKPEDNRLQVSVLLKLSDQIRNTFDYCELQIPLLNGPPVQNVDSSPSQGVVTVSPDKRIVVWNIGQKFPSKSLEVSMTATVYLGDKSKSVCPTSPEDQFCVDLNSYCQLYFMVPEFTHTGCHIDSRSVQVSPAAKFKLTTGREYKSNDYKIWNSLGEALVVKR
ncbi:AP-5 complex subunit mu-1-like [Babylonia areolata]|uniref:AP-5 complex subunit mu-1-like n=1 Tax=Babylonia areolata TaxID=304850 RepID=UPI003FD0CA35